MRRHFAKTACMTVSVLAILIFVIKPKSRPTVAPKQWWQEGPIYEIYVKSFKDSNGDGIGDLNGIFEKLNYFESLGVRSLWLTPIYPSPMRDNGYDVENYLDINPIFGSLDDFKRLVAGVKNKGFKLILDFVPNHTSDKHEWFQKSIKREDPYTDYYVWKDGRNNGPPNNWRSVFGGSAWTKNEERGQYYLHQYYVEQPDLNLYNELVVNELKKILKFWLHLGVDGFRIDAVSRLFEDLSFADETVKPGTSGEKYHDLEHDLTKNLPDIIPLLKQFREILDEKTAEDENNQRLMMTEAYLPVDQLIKYYGDEKKSLEVGDDLSERSSVSQMPLNFGFISYFKTINISATTVRHSIQSYLNQLPSWAWPNFQLGNHDVGRVSYRFGSDLVDAMNIIVMLLPGTPITYYGEEIGMRNGEEHGADKRNKYRTPMQWSNEQNAGFTSAAFPWLPVNPDYETNNVAQKLKKSENGAIPNSHIAIYRYLAKMRKSDVILYGSMDFISGSEVDENIFGFTRFKSGHQGILVLVNFGNVDVVTNLSSIKYISELGVVMVRSVYKPDDFENIREIVAFKKITMRAKEGMVITFDPKM